MLIESRQETSVIMAIIMFDVSVTILKMFTIKMWMTLMLTLNGIWSNVNMSVEKAY